MEEKRDIRKSILSLVLALSMVLSLVPVSVFAANNKTLNLTSLEILGSDLKHELGMTILTKLKIQYEDDGEEKVIEVGNNDTITLAENTEYDYFSGVSIFGRTTWTKIGSFSVNSDLRTEPCITAKNANISYTDDAPYITEQQIMDAVIDVENTNVSITPANSYLTVDGVKVFEALDRMRAELFQSGVEVVVCFEGDEKYLPAQSDKVIVKAIKDESPEILVVFDDLTLSGAEVAELKKNPQEYLLEYAGMEVTDYDLEPVYVKPQGTFEYLAYTYYEKLDLLKLNEKECWREIGSQEITDNEGDHEFFGVIYNEETETSISIDHEEIRFRYTGTEDYKAGVSVRFSVKFQKIETYLEVADNNTIEVSYWENEYEPYALAEDIIRRAFDSYMVNGEYTTPVLTLKNKDTDEVIDITDSIDDYIFYGILTIVPKNLKPSLFPQDVKIVFNGDNAYLGCSAEIKLKLNYGESSVVVKDQVINKGEAVIAPSGYPDYITITTGIDGDAAGFVSVDFPQSVKDMLRFGDPDSGFSLDLYQLICDEFPDEGASLTKFTEIVATILNIAKDVIKDSEFDFSTFDRIIEEINALPIDRVNLKLQLGKPPVEAGVYMVTAITTNVNYKLSRDTGYLIILPDASLDTGIQFNASLNKFGFLTYDDAQDFDFGGQCYEDGIPVDELIQEFYIGHNANGDLVVTREGAPRESGKYTQILYTNRFAKYAIREYVVNLENDAIFHEQGAEYDTGYYNKTEKTWYYAKESVWPEYQLYHDYDLDEYGSYTTYYFNDNGYLQMGLPSRAGYQEILVTDDRNTEYAQNNYCETIYVCNHMDGINSLLVKMSESVYGEDEDYYYKEQIYRCSKCHHEEAVYVEVEKEKPYNPPSPYYPPYTPPVTPVTPTYTVPVSGEAATLAVEVTIDGQKATVKEISKSEIDRMIVGIDPAHLVIDVSKLDANITEVSLSKSTMSNIVEALNGKSDESSLTVIFKIGSITLDKKALKAVLDQLDGSIILTITEIDKLSAIQRISLEELNAVKKYDISLICNGKKISDLKGGIAVITLNYALLTGENQSMLSVWYIATDGEKEQMYTSYFDDVVTFATTHLSTYVIAYQRCSEDEYCPLYDYKDLDVDAWYHDGLHFCISNGFLIGVSSDEMDPYGNLTKSQMATILYRIVQSYGKGFAEDWTYKMPYKDTDSIPDWAYEGVAWLTKEGLFVADANGNFNGTEALTREDFLVYLRAFAIYMQFEMKGSVDWDIDYFADATSISIDALPAVMWALDYEIIYGDDKKRLNPDEEVARAEAAAILARFFQHV